MLNPEKARRAEEAFARSLYRFFFGEEMPTVEEMMDEDFGAENVAFLRHRYNDLKDDRAGHALEVMEEHIRGKLEI